jgi:Uma2 family endonuclease
VNRLAKRFILLARERYEVRIQSPVVLDPHSAPEPDISLAASLVDQLPHLPGTEHLFLAIEVSDSSLGFDRGDKKDAYALRGVPEYWLLNLRDHEMEIYREPAGDRYGSIDKVSAEGFVAPLAFPDIKLRVGDFIP